MKYLKYIIIGLLLGFGFSSVAAPLLNSIVSWNGTNYVSTIAPTFNSFSATSTIATSTIAGPVVVNSSTLIVNTTDNRVGINGNPGHPLEVWSGGTSRFSVRTDGVVIAGTEYRVGNLAVNTNGIRYGVTTGSARLGGVSGSGTTASSAGAEVEVVGIASSTPGAILFRTGTASALQQNESMRITATGDVGIGTSTPSAKLAVAGTVFAQNFVATSSTISSIGTGGLSVSGDITATGVLKGGTSATLSMNGLNGDGMDITYSSGGVFRAAEASVLGTDDVFFQGVPSGVGYTYLEDWSGEGLVLGTGNGANPIIIRPNRSEIARFTTTGTTFITQITITPQASAPGSPTSGMMYMDTTPTPDELCVYDGAGWQALITGTDANCS